MIWNGLVKQRTQTLHDMCSQYEATGYITNTLYPKPNELSTTTRT